MFDVCDSRAVLDRAEAAEAIASAGRLIVPIPAYRRVRSRIADLAERVASADPPGRGAAAAELRRLAIDVDQVDVAAADALRRAAEDIAGPWRA
jgi:hypothetical protein